MQQEAEFRAEELIRKQEDDEKELRMMTENRQFYHGQRETEIRPTKEPPPGFFDLTYSVKPSAQGAAPALGKILQSDAII